MGDVGGATTFCACKGSWQYDPVIEVVPNTGAVYAAYINGFNVVFTRSTDHGATWSTPVKTYGNVSWNDKPALAMSDDGQDVYLSWNGPNAGDPWVAQSHDFGATWTQLKLVDSTATSSRTTPTSSRRDGGLRRERHRLRRPGGRPRRVVNHRVFVSGNHGVTWQDVTRRHGGGR